MPGPMRLRFVASYPALDLLPDTETEVAIVGRSNVGKSSLVNALANRRSLARTSKTPGATRLINAFELEPENSRRWLIDLPGYGFAKVSKAEQQRWASMIGDYLTEREQLQTVLLLIDGAVGPTALDLQTQEWLEFLGRPIAYVATKADKVRPSKSKKRRTELTEKLGVARGDVRWVSATKGTGIPELRADVARLLGSE